MSSGDQYPLPSEILATLVSLGAASITVGGTILMMCGKSPFHISIREAGVDWAYYHIAYFGPSLIVSWVALIEAAFRKVLLPILLAATALYLAGFFFLR